MGRLPLTRTLDIWMNGRLIGHWKRLPSGEVRFLYAESWLNAEGSFAVSRSLPLAPGDQKGEKVAAVFENLLPDGQALRQAIAERTSAASARPYDLLSAIGHDCVGAMQFVPHGQAPGDPFAMESARQSEGEIAETIRSLGFHPLGMKPDDPFRISLAGAQEKTAYLRRDGGWHRPLGLTPTTHIFKRRMGIVGDGIDMSDSIENEYFCLKLAAEMGLRVNDAWIESFEDQDALVVERFDRRPRAAGGYLRLPQEDFLQALGHFSSSKYQDHGGPGLQECFRLIGGSIDQATDQETFLKAQIFFWMIAAIDGHAKNFSIYLGPRGYRMTPLYDIMSAAPGDVRNAFRHRDLRMAMFVGRNRHYRLDAIVPRHFDQTAAEARVPLEVRRKAYRDLAEAGEEAFDRTLAALPNSFPERVAAPIAVYGKDRMRLLQDFALDHANQA